MSPADESANGQKFLIPCGCGVYKQPLGIVRGADGFLNLWGGKLEWSGKEGT